MKDFCVHLFARAFAKNGGCIQILDTTLHRSPSKDHDEFHNFCSELKLLVTNIKQ